MFCLITCAVAGIEYGFGCHLLLVVEKLPHFLFRFIAVYEMQSADKGFHFFDSRETAAGFDDVHRSVVGTGGYDCQAVVRQKTEGVFVVETVGRFPAVFRCCQKSVAVRLCVRMGCGLNGGNAFADVLAVVEIAVSRAVFSITAF